MTKNVTKAKARQKLRASRVLNYISVILTLILLILHFSPFWSVNGDTASLQGYIWFPNQHEGISSYLSSNINGIVLFPVLQLIAGALGVVLCLIYAKSFLVSIAPVFCGAFGIAGFCSNDALKLGSTWAIMLILSILILISGIATIIFGIKESKTKLLKSEAATLEEKAEHIEAVKAISDINEDKNLFSVIDLLKSDDPDYRITAAQKLCEASREVALTHLIFYIKDEQNEEVSAAMRQALVSIRENMKKS